MNRIRIRYVDVLRFGQLGVTESERNMGQGFAFVGERGSSPREWFSDAPA